MLSISYMAQPNYGRINQDLLKKPKTQNGLENWSNAYLNHHDKSDKSMNIDGYGTTAVIRENTRKNNGKVRSLLNSSELAAKQRGVGEEKVGNVDRGFENYEDEDEAVYLVAKFIEVHEELLRYSGYNLWLIIEMQLYEKNIRSKQSADLQKVLTDIVKNVDLNIGNQISEVLGVLGNKVCSQRLREYFAS